MKGVINALNDLHHLGIVHRDLSPDNILIVNREGELHYVLGDFGGAKEVYKGSKGSSSLLIGKPSYIDPERMFNPKYGKDCRMDIYSVGIIITEILMGNLNSKRSFPLWKVKMKKKQSFCSPPVFTESLVGNRDYQEDFYSVVSRDDKTLLIAADGMGGHSSGELASQWVVEELVKQFKENREFEDIIDQGIEGARQKMLDSGKDMGATFAAAMVEKKEEQFEVSLTWIGDSRIYALTSSKTKLENAGEIGTTENNKKLWLLTEDDSFIWGFVLRNELTLDQVTQHPNKNQLEYSVHPEKLQAAEKAVKRINRFTLAPGDKLLLCTDGVWETFLQQSDITGFLDSDNIKEGLSGFLKRAINEGRCADNATYVAVEMKDEMFAQNCFPPKRAAKKMFKKITASGLFGILFSLVVFILILMEFVLC